MLHAENMMAGIPKVKLARARTRGGGEEISSGIADFVAPDIAAERRIVLAPPQDIAEVADPGRRQRLDRAGRDGIHPDRLPTEVGRKVAHRRLQRGLGDPHYVVVGYPL